MNALFVISALLGTDPVSLVIMSLMAAACTWCMHRVMEIRLFSVLSFPMLLVGGLLADDLAVAVGLYPSFDVQPSGDWDFATNLAQISDGLPYVLCSATAGMSVVGLALIALGRRLAPLLS